VIRRQKKLLLLAPTLTRQEEAGVGAEVAAVDEAMEGNDHAQDLLPVAVEKEEIITAATVAALLDHVHALGGQGLGLGPEIAAGGATAVAAPGVETGDLVDVLILVLVLATGGGGPAPDQGDLCRAI